MPNSYLQGIQSTFDNQAQIRNDISVVSTNWFVNRCPLVTRTPRTAAGSTVFTLVNRTYRARTANLAANATSAAIVLTLVDASSLMIGDVLELNSERVEVVKDPDVVANTVEVRRGAEGSTPAAAANGDTLRLIGNSRHGHEVEQRAVSMKPTTVTQYCQTWQHPVQVGGALQASAAYQGPKGTRTPFDESKMIALQNMIDDMEVSSYYGRGEEQTATIRPKQKGLKTLITTNKTLAPTSASAYKATDFIRDTLEKCRTNGGDPDVLLVSSNFMTGLAVWGQAVQRIDAGRNVFGTPIDVFEAPFLGGVSIIEAPLLRPFTAVCLTSGEVRLRMKRNEFWNPRGNRGDAIEGDWIAEGAIELENESHHAWVENISAFSA